MPIHHSSAAGGAARGLHHFPLQHDGLVGQLVGAAAARREMLRQMLRHRLNSGNDAVCSSVSEPTRSARMIKEPLPLIVAPVTLGLGIIGVLKWLLD